MTQTIRDIPVEVSLDEDDGLPAATWVVNLDNLPTIPVALLQDRISALTPQKMVEAERALRFGLALDEFKR